MKGGPHVRITWALTDMHLSAAELSVGPCIRRDPSLVRLGMNLENYVSHVSRRAPKHDKSPGVSDARDG